MVLGLVVVVVSAAACGGWTSGAVAALIRAMSYDFFFTRPYESLKIDRGVDL